MFTSTEVSPRSGDEGGNVSAVSRMLTRRGGRRAIGTGELRPHQDQDEDSDSNFGSSKIHLLVLLMELLDRVQQDSDSDYVSPIMELLSLLTEQFGPTLISGRDQNDDHARQVPKNSSTSMVMGRQVTYESHIIPTNTGFCGHGKFFKEALLPKNV